jgi:hypothetical protein
MLLSNFPNECTIRRRTHTKDSLGGQKASVVVEQTGVSCWEQQAGDSADESFKKRGMNITHKVYFLTNPNVTRRHEILITSRTNHDGTVTTIASPTPLSVLSNPMPDCTAGLGVCYRVLCHEMTSEDD